MVAVGKEGVANSSNDPMPIPLRHHIALNCPARVLFALL